MAIKYNTTANLTIFAVSCTSLFVNLVITSLIVARIMYFIKTIRATLNRNHWSKYRDIVSMLMESAALITLFALAYVILTLALPIKGREFPMESLSALVPMTSMTHIYVGFPSSASKGHFLKFWMQQVIAPCLIIYRVGQGEDWRARSTTGTRVSDLECTRSAARYRSTLNFSKTEAGSSNEHEQHDVESLRDLDNR